jgi:hypothetical protein
MVVGVLTGCDDVGNNEATLYRNSGLDLSLRIHWASFDAEESDPMYNLRNCLMAAKLLNYNLQTQNENLNSRGFWCEPGSYRETGSTPTTFDAEFPVS